jgi:serine/threonine-protein kinase RsbW
MIRPSSAMAFMPPVTIRVAGTQAGIRDAAAAFDDFRQSRSLSDEATWPVMVALDEVLANIVGHAYEGHEAGVIDLRFTVAGSSLMIAIWDDGPPVNPLALPEPDTSAPLEAREPGGLGIHLVKRLMQGARYTREGDRNCLELVKDLEGPGPAGNQEPKAGSRTP